MFSVQGMSSVRRGLGISAARNLVIEERRLVVECGLRRLIGIITNWSVVGVTGHEVLVFGLPKQVNTRGSVVVVNGFHYSIRLA